MKKHHSLILVMIVMKLWMLHSWLSLQWIPNTEYYLFLLLFYIDHNYFLWFILSIAVYNEEWLWKSIQKQNSGVLFLYHFYLSLMDEVHCYWCRCVFEAKYDSLTSLSFSSSWSMFGVTVPWTSTLELMTKYRFTCVYMYCASIAFIVIYELKKLKK